MNETEINVEAYKLIDLLTQEESDSVKEDNKPQDFVGISEAFNLGEVQNLKIIQPDLYGNVVARYIPLKNKRIGLNPANYKSLQELCAEILSFPGILEYADNKFVEASCFDWVMDVYFTKQAKQDILTYIKSCLENELDVYTFY